MKRRTTANSVVLFFVIISLDSGNMELKQLVSNVLPAEIICYYYCFFGSSG